MALVFLATTIPAFADNSTNTEPLSVSAEIGDDDYGYISTIITFANVTGTSVLIQAVSFNGTTVFEVDRAVDETHSGELYWNHIEYHPTGTYTFSVTDDVTTASDTINWDNSEPTGITLSVGSQTHYYDEENIRIIAERRNISGSLPAMTATKKTAIESASVFQPRIVLLWQAAFDNIHKPIPIMNPANARSAKGALGL